MTHVLAGRCLSRRLSTVRCHLRSLATAADAMGLPAQMSPETIATVKATAPAVAPNAHLITQKFYADMLSQNEELFTFFSRSNQASGAQAQTLADAVVAYASNIDNLSALAGFEGSPVQLMAHKHCALQVMPEHCESSRILASSRQLNVVLA